MRRTSTEQSAHGARRGPRAQRHAAETDLAIIDRLLLRRVSVTLNGVKEEATALDAILFQLMQKARGGDNRASRVFVKYQSLVPQRMNRPRVVYVGADAMQWSAAEIEESLDA